MPICRDCGMDDCDGRCIGACRAKFGGPYDFHLFPTVEPDVAAEQIRKGLPPVIDPAAAGRKIRAALPADE